MKTKRIILVSALSLLCAGGFMAQTKPTLTDYVAKGTTYLFECDTIHFNGGSRTVTGDNATLILTEKQTPFNVVWQDSIVRGETYLYGCDRFTTDTRLFDTIRGWERDTVHTFLLKVLEPKPISVQLFDTVCNGRKYLFGCEVLHTDTIFALQTDTTIVRTDTIALPFRDSVVTLQLTVLSPDTFSTAQSVCSGDSIQLVDGDSTFYSRDTTFTRVIMNGYGCRSIGTYTLVVIQPDTTRIDTTICEGSHYTFGDTTLTTEGTYYRTTSSLSTGCDSVVELKLTVTPAEVTTSHDTICTGTTYDFHGKILDKTGTYRDTVYAEDTHCMSITELVLVVRDCLTRDEYVKSYVCADTEYQGRLKSYTITEPTKWEDIVRVYMDGAQVDSVYHYNIAPYILTLPVIPDSSIIVRCGKAIDITKANSIVQDHITATGEAYAPNVVITWQWFDNNVWQDLPGTTAIRGGVNEVQVRCAVTTDCGSTDTTLTVPVVEPAPENDSTMDNMPASSMYGNRLLIVNKHAIDSIYGWDIQPADVVWYRMQGAAPDVAVDKSVHTGLYYTADEAFAGKYYARITHQSVNASDCGGTLRTVVLTCEKEANSLSPQLIPTVAHPAEQMRLLNLNAAAITEIRVYNTSGELQSSYTSAEATEFLFRAAHSAGYYLVDVVTEDSKVTLRYIVK